MADAMDRYDAKVVALVKRGVSKFGDLHVAIDGAKPSTMRTLDKALQRLKRKGVIVYTRGAGWQAKT